MPNSLDIFFEAIRDSLESHAKRKGYHAGDANGENKMLEASRMLGFSPDHELGEILYKLAEFKAAPRRVLMEKIAAWAFLLWRNAGE
jgi:hypothetical protein